jgi:hypothetical protein
MPRRATGHIAVPPNAHRVRRSRRRGRQPQVRPAELEQKPVVVAAFLYRSGSGHTQMPDSGHRPQKHTLSGTRRVKFCHRIGLNYVSCSPFRISVARLAAAQAALQEKRVSSRDELPHVAHRGRFLPAPPRRSHPWSVSTAFERAQYIRGISTSWRTVDPH